MKIGNNCHHRILFYFPVPKIGNQNEKMKQNAVGWNNWKKSRIFFHLCQFLLQKTRLKKIVSKSYWQRSAWNRDIVPENFRCQGHASRIFQTPGLSRIFLSSGTRVRGDFWFWVPRPVPGPGFFKFHAPVPEFAEIGKSSIPSSDRAKSSQAEGLIESLSNWFFGYNIV